MEDLSFLPGYRFPDITRTNFSVPQTLSYKNGHRIVRTRKQETQLTEEEQRLLNDFPPELIYGKVRVQAPTKPFIPARVYYDKKILRFYGYFNQMIHDSPVECFRVRRVILYYYLEDDTMAIYEIPYENSALNQGLRVRRHRFVKNDQNEFYNWKDLNLGENLFLYGTTYRICDCDRFTREWLESEGIEVQCTEPIPNDPYLEKLILNRENERQRTGPSDLKEILSDRWTGEARIGNKQFYQLDGQVLRFHAVLDDDVDDRRRRPATEKDQRKFFIHFYLVDQTIDIRVLRSANDGYEPNSTYLHRIKVPKDPNYPINSFVNLFTSKQEQDKIDYLNLEDFRHGGPINIFHRHFFLYDCDCCTKNYLQEKFGHCPFPIIDLDAKRTPSSPLRLPSRSSVPKRSMKDRRQWTENENRVLRYRAVLISPRDEDQQREFVIIYRLADDFISVYEKPLDGFGSSTRKFLERLRIPKPESDPNAPVHYGAKDFYIGACVEFFKHRFRIVDVERCVLNFVEANASDYSPDVLQSLRDRFDVCQ